MVEQGKLNLNQKVKNDFLNYANAVIKSRAIPSIEDNLKPVHRRILYAMSELGLASNKKEKKSARIVGDVIGKYHPHGDLSVYDAMVRLSQPWKMRYPLVEIQGNGGSISGDSAAAMRYTEAKLSKFGDLMLHGLNDGAVRFKPTYDETGKEPVILPSVFPNILCNANDGIAVGMSTNLAPHNLKEAVAAIVAYLDYKGINIEGLMKHLPAPDYPTGGTILNTEKMKEIYSMGSGTVTLRSKYNIENVRNVQHIVITEIPYLVGIDTRNGLIDQLKKLVVEENFDLIDDFQDASGNNKINIRIILKKGANVYRVLDTLWKNTRLQITQRISNTVIVDGMPKVLNLKELIEHYISHRHNVIINVAKADLDKVQAKILVTKALLKALASIDEVIALIKESDDRADARTKLVSLLDISEFQANAILDMRLVKLSKLDGMDLKKEHEKLLEEELKLKELIAEPSIREKQMKMELLQLSAQYGDERRTVLNYGIDGDREDLPIENIKILFTETGKMFATQKEYKDLDLRRKASLLNESAITLSVETKTNSKLSVFTKDGNMTNIDTLTLNLDAFDMSGFDAAPLAAIDLENTNKEFILFVTSGGLVKKTRLSEYRSARNNTRTIRLKGDQELIFVGAANDDDYLAILDDRMGFFKVSSVTPTSKLTVGSKGISSGKAVSAAVISEKEHLLMLNAAGQGKLTAAEDFIETARGGVGQVVADDTVLVSARKEHYFIYDGSKNFFIDKNPAIRAKNAVGSRLVIGTPIWISK